ncbi:Calcipressin-domain-containing protein [Mycena floridula]|nr:Calcipressin-domain-containing protein [Mycena floridula]
MFTTSSSSASSQYYQKTNTIAITSLPRSYFCPQILEVLQRHFSSYGEINRWVPLPGFGRILVVYVNDRDAETAKLQCDTIKLDATPDRAAVTLRVYRADPNPISAESSYLEPPPIEKNFLISPPGSPPVGWEQLREEPPNVTPLADDLIAALRKLQLRRSSVEILLDPHEGSGVGVYVEDCGDGYESDIELQEESWTYGFTSSRSKWGATVMPPIFRAGITV